MQQGGRPHDLLGTRIDALEGSPFFEQAQGDPGKVPGPERVLESGMRRARIHQERETQLAHIAQPLDDGRFEERQRERIEADVVPEWIAKNLHIQTI